MLLAFDSIAVLRSAWAKVVEELEAKRVSDSVDCYRGGGVGPLCLVNQENLKQRCMDPKDRSSAVQQRMDMFMKALRDVSPNSPL